MLFQILLPILFFHFCYSIEEGQEYWRSKGIEELTNSFKIKYNKNVAKNVILFIGDGMGLTTITASRISSKGEKGFLAWEKFDHIGVLKIYSNNKLVPDSCSTATALFCGVKANHKTAGVDASVSANDCQASLDPKTHTPSIFDWAIDAGKSTGFVTTTRVTHATPSALYAHTVNRKWECEASMPPNATQCKDIARQLIEDYPGKNIKVIMGGGRQTLQSNVSSKPGDPIENWVCKSMDGRDLISDWLKDKEKRQVSHAVVSNNEELEKLSESTEFVLGIFANGHLSQNYKRDKSSKGMPSLWNMTQKAIKVLQKNDKGYILMVEGGLIDMAHHRGHAKVALDEAKELSDTVEETLRIVDTRDTLIIVTSDHSHALMFVGHINRNESIFGVADLKNKSYVPYTALMYGTGPKSNFQYEVRNGTTVARRDPSLDKTDDFEYFQQTGILDAEVVHGGTDVLIYATGPMSHLVSSVKEQTFVAYLVSYAAKIGPLKDLQNGATRISLHISYMIISVISSFKMLMLVTDNNTGFLKLF